MIDDALGKVAPLEGIGGMELIIDVPIGLFEGDILVGAFLTSWTFVTVLDPAKPRSGEQRFS